MNSNAIISHSNWSPLIQNPLDVKSPSKRKTSDLKPKECEIEFGTVCSPGRVLITLPVRTLSPNQFEPWQKRHKREKAQKRAVMFALIPIKQQIRLPCVLKFIRYAPKWLDKHDNLPMSMKKMVDQACAEIVCDFVPGRADSYDCFTIEYDQVKSKTYAVQIEITY